MTAMFQQTSQKDWFFAAVLWTCVLIAISPLYLVVAIASHDAQSLIKDGVSFWFGSQLFENLAVAWRTDGLGRQLVNSTVVAILVTVGKLVLGSLSAFAVVYFNTRISRVLFWAVFLTMMLPLEVRIVPTYELAANVLKPIQDVVEILGISEFLGSILGVRVSLHWSLLDTYIGLSLPLVATATGTFLFRQYFRTLPYSLVEAARLDGAGPLRFLVDIVVPLSSRHFAALATIMFLSAWNQYLWPLIATTEESMRTAVIGVTHLVPDLEYDAPAWNVTMAGALITMLPPIVVVAVFQRLLVTGLTMGRTPENSAGDDRRG